MPRLLVHVEGETEETFVNEVLAPHLRGRGYTQVSARMLGNARQRHLRGGIKGWDSAHTDIVTHLKEDPSCLVTTMVDYYALPQVGTRAWPGRAAAGQLPFGQKAASIQAAMLAAISGEMGDTFDRKRFIPYVVMHEFEGLLFSDCARFARGIGRPDLVTEFQAIRDHFHSPEAINDSPLTAPSKRVEALVPRYSKPLLGTLAAIEIGFENIRDQCPNFRNWVAILEALT